MPSRDRGWTVLLPLFAAVALTGVWFAGTAGRRESNSLVVYCAHDQIYAEQILRDFEQQTGIPVEIRSDTEATKSLGLINLILQEQRHPRCDVFWNNEMLGTLDLQSQGLLEPYRGSAWERLPEKYRDPHGHWIGFGARLRVYVVNTERIPADDEAVQNVFALETSHAAMAKPLFGTTLTHYTVLWHEWGPDRLKAWHYELRRRGLREVNGNGPVKDLVAMGTCEAGMTDTDDVFVAIDDKLPVEMLPVRVDVGHDVSKATTPERSVATDERPKTTSDAPPTQSPSLDDRSGVARRGEGTEEKTICIPNTAAIIRGTRKLDAAQRLIDFLGSEETELALARSKSRQVPLGPVEESRLPSDVARLKRWADDGFDLRAMLPARRSCLEWLKSEYVK
jgi:iron(III) transport system substrate-binding protein